MSVSPWKEPLWLTMMQEGDAKDSARVRYNLTIAALHATPEGTIRALADLISWPESSFSIARKRGSLPMKVASVIENVVGRDVMPREVLCPEFTQVKV